MISKTVRANNLRKADYNEFAADICLDNDAEYISEKYQVSLSTVRNYQNYAKGSKINRAMANIIYKSQGKGVRAAIDYYLDNNKTGIGYTNAGKAEPSQNIVHKPCSSRHTVEREIQVEEFFEQLPLDVPENQETPKQNSVKIEKPITAREKFELLQRIITILETL